MRALDHIDNVTRVWATAGAPWGRTVHASPDCPHAPGEGPGEWCEVDDHDGWECGCLDVDAIPRGLGENIRNPSGDGTGEGTSRASVASVANWAKLDGDGGWGIAIPMGHAYSPGDSVPVTKKSGEVSDVVIGERVGYKSGKSLYALPTAPTNGADSGDVVARWAKLGDAWVLALPMGHGKVPGDVVTVTKKSGESRDMVLGKSGGKSGDRELFAPGGDAPTVDKSGESVEVIAGRIYRLSDDRIARPQESKAGRMYAKVLTPDGWEYERGALSDIVELLPLDAALAYGQETGRCVCCGRELTNPDSIAAGIGPVCREKHYG